MPDTVPVRVQRKRTKGWRMPPGVIYVGRPSRYGNPFRIGGLIRDPGYSGGPAHPYDGPLPEGVHGTYGHAFEVRRVRDAADATDLFAAYVEAHDDEWPPDVIRRELGGRDLACWCPLPAPGEPDHCHAAVLLQLANDATIKSQVAKCPPHARGGEPTFSMRLLVAAASSPRTWG